MKWMLITQHSYREVRTFFITVPQYPDKIGYKLTSVTGVGAEDAGNSFFAVERCPGKFPVVIVEKTGRQADAFMGSHIGKRGIVVVAVEVGKVKLLQYPLLYGAQFRLGAAAHHQRASCQIVNHDFIFLCQRVRRFADEINSALKQWVDFYIGDAFHVFLSGEDHVLFAPQKTVHAVEWDKFRRNGNAFMGMFKLFNCLRQEINGGTHGQADGQVGVIPAAVVLSLFNGAL